MKVARVVKPVQRQKSLQKTSTGGPLDAEFDIQYSDSSPEDMNTLLQISLFVLLADQAPLSLPIFSDSALITSARSLSSKHGDPTVPLPKFIT